MGFSYTDWAGVFYPRSVKPGDYLAHYARHFDTVELDTTFHATPPAERFRRWAAAVPDHFRFCMKAPRLVTHDLPLDRAAGAMADFLTVARELGDKLAVVLLQFPPSLGARELPRLRALLRTLPADVRFAAEFRSTSWWADGARDRTADALSQHGVCWAAAEYQAAPRDVRPTTDFLYVRWIGEHDRYQELNREQADVTPRLLWWKDELTRVAPSGGVRTVYGFFNNDYAGYSVATCNRFKGLLGLPVPSMDAPGQGRLFD
jgi:uncharacterized protein YecE (DUF72 family)